jgi:hypothetical protein
VVPEAPLEETAHGLVPKGDGWFVVNARAAAWRDRPGRGLRCVFEGEPDFPQFGISLYVLGLGEPMAMDGSLPRLAILHRSVPRRPRV